MPNSIKKKLQLYRNENVFVPSGNLTALEVAKQELSLQTLSDGEILIARYQETNADIKTVVAIAHHINNNNGLSFFTECGDSGQAISDTQKTFLKFTVNNGSLSFTDFNNTQLTHAQVKSIISDAEKDVVFLDTSVSDVFTMFIFTDSENFVMGNFSDSGFHRISIFWFNNSYIVDEELNIRLLSSDVDLETLNNYFPVVANLNKVKQTTKTVAANVTINPYTLNDFGTVSRDMTISFNTSLEVSGYTKEYIIRFVAGNGCAITLPNGVLYANGVTPTYTVGHTYEIDIVNGCAAVGEFY